MVDSAPLAFLGGSDRRDLIELGLERIRTAPEGMKTSLVTALARLLLVDRRTVYRWLENGPPARRGRKPLELTEELLNAYVACRGNATEAHRQLDESGAQPPKLRTLQAALARELTPGDRAYYRAGAAARNDHRVYLLYEADRRNWRWEMDHKQLDIEVIPPRGRNPRKPWVTLIVEVFSRLIMGWAIDLSPTSGTVLAALAEAVALRPDKPYGGLPEQVRPDNALEFVADAIEEACAALGIAVLPAPPYSPEKKGKVERCAGTIVTSFLTDKPFFTKGPRGQDGDLIHAGPGRLTLVELVSEFSSWVDRFNREMVHSAIRTTPIERWLSDATPVRSVPLERLRWMMLKANERTIGKGGIRALGGKYVAPELNGLGGTRVQIRYLPHVTGTIEVFRGEEWLCTATRQGQLTSGERDAVLDARREEARRQQAVARKARRRSTYRIVPMTRPGTPELATVVTADEAAKEDSARRRDNLRANASTSLLGIEAI